MKTQKTRGVKPTSPSRRRKSRFTLRGRKKKDGVIRGKLRIRSMPGAFLVLGAVVVVVGTALAVAGYWPYRLSRSSLLEAAGGEGVSESQASGWSLGAKGLLSTAGLVHSERMKLLGPVIMGVGLFILICANTVLYENRDRETQMLLAQMRSVICSVSAAVPSADLKEMAAANSMARHYQWVSSLPAAHLNILCLQQLTSSEPVLQTGRGEATEGAYQQAVLQTEALHHHQESELPVTQEGGGGSDSSQADFAVQPQRAAAPLIKVDHRPASASSLSTLGADGADTPAAQPRRCHSVSYRTNPYPVRAEGRPAAVRAVAEGEAGSEVRVDVPAPAAPEEQTRRSWPRLDLGGGGGRRYLKLENKEDSVDRLLDQLEQQYSHWDKSFGSGPFQ